MFCKSIFQSAFGTSDVKATTFAFECVYHISCVAICKRSDLVGSFADDVNKAAGFDDVLAVVASFFFFFFLT